MREWGLVPTGRARLVTGEGAEQRGDDRLPGQLGHAMQQLLGDATAASPAVTGVAEVLDALSARLGGGEAASCCRTLQKVLGTALAKEEPKYRRLRARNERLWALLLRHPEIMLLLQAAGFEETSSTESEAEEVQAALAAQLDSAQPDQAVVESLVSRMEALVPGAGEQGAEEGRTAEFVHPGGAALAGPLG